MPQPLLTRRESLGALSATAAIPLFAGAMPAFAAPASEAQAKALLGSIGGNLLRTQPGGATTLGIDVGTRAAYRYRLEDRSPAGQARIAATLKADLARAEAIDTSALTFPTRTGVEVVKSAYRTALEGFALPYGDVAVGGWRNTPYVVIQNVGAYIDTPKFLDAEHPIENRSDAEAYLARLALCPLQLDGELGRMRAARAKGLVPPAFLIDKAVGQLGIALADARNGGNIVESLVKRTRAKGIAGDWESPARRIVTGQVAPALQRQIGELQAERGVANDLPGMWSRPHGEEYYRWALKASTTTNLSPDEVHRMGLEQLNELHGRMDPILKSLGYTQGTVGERMQALAKDPRYKFSEGDKGRAEITAYIQQWLALIRAQLPR
ncbi:MAG: hypothetical protein QOD54_604, partial [Sphingomonadales bacterium]|nr:hypothetical protein [Sphingomonadales bacterium]